jgi:hypothetical protein
MYRARECLAFHVAYTRANRQCSARFGLLVWSAAHSRRDDATFTKAMLSSYLPANAPTACPINS